MTQIPRVQEFIPIMENQHSAVLFLEFHESCEDFIFQLQEKWYSSPMQEILVVSQTSLTQPWLTQNQELQFVYLLERKLRDFIITKVTINSEKANFFIKSGDIFQLHHISFLLNINPDFYQTLKNKVLQIPFVFSPQECFMFQPVSIPKPWGQEIWYTGVEKRGVSQIQTLLSFSLGCTHPLPLPWFFAALPKTLLGEKYADKNLILIKILDPLPEEVVGDLYYELHQEKNEVYIVTRILQQVGKIKIGINPKKIEQYKGDIKNLKKDFLNAIKNYQKIRSEIDVLEIDIPEEMKKREIELRSKMDEFTGYLNLQVGDVVVVPTLVPHALQHGVQVIEFQTPTYERLIISFAQKVLTQNHWDTEQAMELMDVQAPQKTKLKRLVKSADYTVEQVCAFADFQVVRINLSKKKSYLCNQLPHYQVLFFVKGSAKLNLGGQKYTVKDGLCVFIPPLSQVSLCAQEEMIFLISSPENLIIEESVL